MAVPDMSSYNFSASKCRKPVIDIQPELIAINPGSLSYPRQEGRRRSYIIMDLDKNGDAHFTINYI